MAESRQAPIQLRNALIVSVIAVAGALALWFWLFRTPPATPDAGKRSSEPAAAAAVEPVAAVAEPTVERTGEEGLPETRWVELLGAEPRWPLDLHDPEDCAEVERALAAVCAIYDRNAADWGAGLDTTGACELLQDAALDLAGRPPAVTSELRSHGAVLANAFHLFRVLGRDRLSAIKRMLESEPALTEPLSLAFYRWTVSRPECATDRQALPRETLYEYATFVFNTLGGQAYLRRRQPQAESLACFYALGVLDRAIERRHNPHGADPRPELDRCRALMQGQPLVFGEQYVTELDAMKRRWGSRSGSGPQ